MENFDRSAEEDARLGVSAVAPEEAAAGTGVGAVSNDSSAAVPPPSKLPRLSGHSILTGDAGSPAVSSPTAGAGADAEPEPHDLFTFQAICPRCSQKSVFFSFIHLPTHTPSYAIFSYSYANYAAFMLNENDCLCIILLR